MDKESRTSFVLIIGFGILILLIGVLGFRAVQRAESIYKEMQVAQDAYLRTEEFRQGFVADMYLSDVLVRDYLLIHAGTAFQLASVSRRCVIHFRNGWIYFLQAREGSWRLTGRSFNPKSKLTGKGRRFKRGGQP